MRRPARKVHRSYRLRLMACLAGSLLVVTAAFRLWPFAPAPSAVSPTPAPTERITLREVVQTRQSPSSSSTPPPPAPLPPVEEPEPFEAEELAIDFSANPLPLSPPSEGTAGDGEATSDGEPATAPRPVRYVEPEYTDAAQKNRIRASVTIELTVDKQGRVQEAQIVRRLMIGEGDSSRAVDQIGYGLDEAALSAARRWRFQPARRGSRPVAGTTTVTFTFGV